MNEIITNKSPTRTLEELSDKEKKLVQKKIELIDYMNPFSIIQFGSESSREVTALSSDMISKFKTKDFDDAQELIANLLANLKTVDINALLESKKTGSIFSRISSGGKKAEERVVKIITQQISIERRIDEIEDKLVLIKIALINDMEFCLQMIEKTWEYLKSQEIDYLAIQEAIKNAQKEKSYLERAFKQNPNNMEYSCKISNLDKAINSLERKTESMLLFRTSTLQSIVQIGLVQEGDETMVSKIEDAIINVIPLWKRNFAIGMQIYQLNNAVIIQKLVDNTANELLKKNAEILKETLLQTASEMERTTIDPETLKEVNKSLEETFMGISKVREEMKNTRSEAMKTIQSVQGLSLELQSGINASRSEV